MALLQPYAQTLGRTDGYRVSDILGEHTTRPAPGTPDRTPVRVWTHLTQCAAPAACLPIGLAAYYAGLRRQARAA
ncbi:MULTISPECIES: hypothetical protein [unclassified Streptomyces]|uniref:hypothetical protein n=1 Tax=unclassified Streptomyces TaxID=2593676 RepID=UPI00380FF0C0